MNEDGEHGPVWARLDALSDAELALLVEAAVGVLEAGAPEPSELPAAQLPPTALARELQAALAQRPGPGSRLDPRAIQQPELAAPAARLLLREIGREPLLAAEIAAAYEARQRLLLGPEMILAGALFLMVLKLRRVKVGSEGVEVELDSVSEGSLRALLGALGRG